jgi:hypothetical protein
MDHGSAKGGGKAKKYQQFNKAKQGEITNKRRGRKESAGHCGKKIQTISP